MTQSSGKRYVVAFVLAIVFGILPFSIFLGLALNEDSCWEQTSLSSETWLIVFAVDLLLSLGIGIPAFYHHCGRNYRSGHSINWYWVSALIWLFDIGWLAAVSYQVGKLTLDDCGLPLIVTAMSILCLKIIWTPLCLFMVLIAG